MSLTMRWLGTACFELILPDGRHLLMDPYLDESNNSPIKADQIEACDLMFITHGHWDHVLDIGYLAGKFSPPIFCNADTLESITRHQQVDENLIKVLTVGDVVELPGLKVEVLGGVHADATKEYKRLTGKNPPPRGDYTTALAWSKAFTLETQGTDQIHQKHLDWRAMYPGGEQLNFVFEFADGQRIYMAGSYPDPMVAKEAEKAHADLTLMQCMSSDKLRGLEQATAGVILVSGCKTAVPQHHDPLYEGGRRTDLGLLKAMVEEQGVAFREVTPGEWYRVERGVMEKVI